MGYWETKMQVVNQQAKEIFWVCGMTVKASTREAAQAILDKHDFFYLVLGDRIVAEIPCKPGLMTQIGGK